MQAARKGNAFDITSWGTQQKPDVTSEMISQPGPGGYGYNSVFVLPFDGETDMGEMGPIRKYLADHQALRLRSHQLDLESDVCSALFERSKMWGVGTGLKLQAEPKGLVLDGAGVQLDTEEFNEGIEEFFGTWASNPMCDYSSVQNLTDISGEAWSDIDKGGDTLVVMRLVNDMPKCELIDASYVRTPLNFGTLTGLEVINPDTKNRIRHGVEMDKAGKHVAYWVVKGDNWLQDGFERIECRMSKYPYSEMARMCYGRKHRIDNSRGIPIISAVMETAAKMGRYMSAALASAEERAKVVYTINHTAKSTGESPIMAQMAKASGIYFNSGLPTDSQGRELANQVAASTNKQTFDMPLESEMKTLESKQELHVRDFYTVNFDIVCAVVGYPPEVIMSKYNSNYSASRAAIKDFEHTLTVKRNRFAKQFMQMVYNYYLDWMVLSNKIKAPGYLNALGKRDEMVLTAYRHAEWMGDTVPHIDPVKEVMAWRLKMGAGTDHLPLCTAEEAAEALSSISLSSIMEQSSKERLMADELGIEKVEINKQVIEDFDDEEEDKPGKPGRKGDDKKQTKKA